MFDIQFVVGEKGEDTKVHGIPSGIYGSFNQHRNGIENQIIELEFDVLRIFYL